MPAQSTVGILSIEMYYNCVRARKLQLSIKAYLIIIILFLFYKFGNTSFCPMSQILYNLLGDTIQYQNRIELIKTNFE